MRIKEAINRILWGVERKEDYFLVIVDRVSSSGYTYIPFSHIKHVDNNYVYVCRETCSNTSSGSETVIPMHRVIRIERRNGDIVWNRG